MSGRGRGPRCENRLPGKLNGKGEPLDKEKICTQGDVQLVFEYRGGNGHRLKCRDMWRVDLPGHFAFKCSNVWPIDNHRSTGIIRGDGEIVYLLVAQDTLKLSVTRPSELAIQCTRIVHSLYLATSKHFLLLRYSGHHRVSANLVPIVVRFENV
jgi:hypothetical protein